MNKIRKKFTFSLSLLICGFFLIISNQTIAASSISNKNLHDVLLKQGYIEVPLKKGTNGYLFVEATFGSNIHYPLLLDTGCGHTNLDPKMMEKFNFQKTGRVRAGGNGDSYSKMEYEIIIPTLQLGNFITHDETVYVASHSPPAEMQINKKSEAGLLGIDFLRKHSAIIDIANQYLYLKPTNKNQLLSNQSIYYQKILLDAGYKSIKLEHSSDNLLLLTASINNAQSEKYLLDSGSIMLLSLDYAKKQHLPLAERQIVMGKGADNGAMKMFRISIDQLKVDSSTWNPSFALATGFQYIQKGVGIALAGVIGIDWMNATHAIIDIGSDKIFIKPVAALTTGTNDRR
jgi:hypothetical protein